MEANRFRSRAWSTKYNLFLAEVEIYSDGSFTADYRREDGALVSQNMDECIVEQSTGLADAKGVEIFEGDIVLKQTGTSIPVIIEHDGERLTAYRKKPPAPATVLWHRGKFILHNTQTADDCFGTVGYYGVLDAGQNRSPYELEVIGNIHQNPELLEANNGGE